MRRIELQAAIALVTLLATTACNKDKTSKSDAEAAASTDQKVEEMVEDAAKKAGVVFDKGMSKKACEILTAPLVAKTFGVPEKELKQTKVMGCIYNWREKEGDEIKTMLETRVTMLRVHKSEEDAKRWFKNSTANKTGEQAKAEMKLVTEKAKEREEVDTKMKKDTLDGLGALAAQSMSDGYSYEAISGIGDEAKVAKNDGAVWARVGNLTLTVGAYKGPPQPKIEFDIKDMKGMAKRSIQAQKEWLDKTHEERKEASIKLAKLVIAELD